MAANAPGRNRTYDLWLRKALYPLSYERARGSLPAALRRSSCTRKVVRSGGALADVSETYADLVTTLFSSTIAAKAWFATAAVVLALVQVTTAARMWGRLGFLRVRGPSVARVHRWSGRLAFLFTLPVFFHCVVGFATPDTRVAVHSLAGTFIYGVFAAKVLIVRDRSLPGDPAGGRDHAGVDTRPRVADLEPLVLHERAVRLLMGRGWRPLVVGASSSWRRSFSRSSPCSSLEVVRVGGDFDRGEVVFERECAGCHGPGGEGRSPGPRLIDTALDAAEVASVIEQARGSCLQRSCPVASRRTSSPTSSRSAGRKLQSVEIQARIVRLQLAETSSSSRRHRSRRRRPCGSEPPGR